MKLTIDIGPTSKSEILLKLQRIVKELNEGKTETSEYDEGTGIMFWELSE